MTSSEISQKSVPAVAALPIIGIGMATSLGGVVAAAAAHRAGISRTQELIDHPAVDPFTHEQTYLFGHQAQGIESGFRGLARYVKLMRLAIEDLKHNYPTILSGRTGLCLILPAGADSEGWGLPYPRFSAADLVQTLIQQKILVPHRTVTVCSASHQTEEALRAGSAMLADNSVDHCVILAVDSFIEWRRLRAALQAGHLKSAENPLGFSPGEAACAIVLAPAHATFNKDVVLGVLHIPQETDGTQVRKTEPQKTGTLLREALNNLPANAHGRVFVNLTGESWCAQQWGMLQVATRMEKWESRFPVIAFGHVGVAFSCLAIALALRGFRREPRAGHSSVIIELHPDHHESFLILETI